MAVELNVIVAYGLGIIILYALGRSFVMPMKFFAKLIINTALGAIILLIVNYIGGFFGFNIALNVVTAIITGFLGIPGVILLILLKSVLGI